MFLCGLLAFEMHCRAANYENHHRRPVIDETRVNKGPKSSSLDTAQQTEK
jgi:hypothetical protein